VDEERLRIVHDCPWLGVSVLVFTARRHASAVYAIVVCLSLTNQCSTETAKRRIVQTMPHRFSSFLMPMISAKLKRGHPSTEVLNAGGVG